MIEIFGVAVSYEVAILLSVFLVDEILPFLPMKYNGLAHGLVRLLTKVHIRPGRDERIELVLRRLDELKYEVDASKLDSLIKEVREGGGRGR
jgi:hypothetical protein